LSRVELDDQVFMGVRATVFALRITGLTTRQLVFWRSVPRHEVDKNRKKCATTSG
jgi:hypothetical protein